MQKNGRKKSKDNVDPGAREGPVHGSSSTMIETYVATGEGHLKLTAFYVRVDRKDQDKSPLRRLIESADWMDAE